MKELLDKIPYEKIWIIPPWQRWLGLFGLIFLFFVIYYYVSYKDSVEAIERLASERNTLEAKYNENVIYTEKMPQLQKNIDQLNKILINARTQLPNAKEIPELLTLISETGTNAGLEFLLFKPFPEQKVDFYSKVPVEMVIVGSFHNIVTFFDKVKKMSRIVDISGVKINISVKNRQITLRASCKATTYKYLEGAVS